MLIVPSITIVEEGSLVGGEREDVEEHAVEAPGLC